MARPKNIKVHPEFRDIFPKLPVSEYELLKAKIEREGLTEPLKAWNCEDGPWLLDGHNRLAICEELGIRPRWVAVDEVHTLDDAKRWVINNQLARRNVTSFHRAYLIGMRFNMVKAQGARSDLYRVAGDTGDSLAKEYNVTRPAIVQMGQFSAAVDILEDTIEAKDRILAQEHKLSRDEIIWIAQQPEEEHREIWTRALESRKDLQAEIKKRGKTSGKRLQSPRMKRETPEPAAAHYDFPDMVRLLTSRWPAEKIERTTFSERALAVLEEQFDELEAILEAVKVLLGRDDDPAEMADAPHNAGWPA